MTRLEVLMAVRGLLSEPENWLKDGLACNEDGRKVSVSHPRASKLSLDGAFYRVAHITQSSSCGPAYELLKYTIATSRTIPVAAFNNARGTTHWAVTQMLDRAIRLAGGTPPSQETNDAE